MNYLIEQALDEASSIPDTVTGKLPLPVHFLLR